MDVVRNQFQEAVIPINIPIHIEDSKIHNVFGETLMPSRAIVAKV